MRRVVVIGSANIDLTVKLDRIPQLGETVSEGEFYTSFGGKGANQAVAAHKAGAEVRFIAKVGNDHNGDAIVQHLGALGLGVDGILKDNSLPSGVALIMVDRLGNNAIAVAPGSNANLTVEDIYNAQSHIAWAEVLLIQLEIPLLTVKEGLRIAKANGLMSILNPAPASPLTTEILSLTDIITPNEVEAIALSGFRTKDMDETVRATRKLVESGVGQVIITLGEKGACWVHRGGIQFFSPFQVDVVDTTAAGDAFNGALACGLAEGQPMPDAIRFASAAGALAVTRRGAQDSLPSREEIDRVLNTFHR
jgi:ribokinase